MPYTRANQPTADDPSATTNTASVPDPDTGGDLAAAIALLAQTLATQNVHPQPAPNAPAMPVYCMVTVRVDIFCIYIFGWEGVVRISVEDKEVAQINVVSPQVSGTDQPDHYGQIRPLWPTPNLE